MSTVYDLAVLRGDGIGAEVVNEALKVLDAVEQVYGFQTKREDLPYGAEHFLKTGEMMPDVAFDRLRDMHAVLFGAQSPITARRIQVDCPAPKHRPHRAIRSP